MFSHHREFLFGFLTSVFVLMGASHLLMGSPLRGLLKPHSAGVLLTAAESRVGAVGSRTTDISGKWHFVLDTEDGNRDVEAQLKLTGDQVTGIWQKADVKGTFRGTDLDLAFPLTSEEAGMTATLKLKGTLTDGKLKGRWAYAEYSGDFTATPEH